jgi:hypothetical protein
LHQPRQVALQMRSESEEIRDYDNVGHAARGQTLDGAREIGLAELQKRWFHGVPARRGHLSRDIPHRLVGGFNPGAMRKDDETSHA